MSGKLKNLLAWCMWPPECRPRLNVKAVIQGITIHIIRIRRLWDLLDGIFILRVPIHLSGKQFIAYEGVTHIRGLAACVGAYRTSRTLTHLYNISLSSKIIPGEWKLARITPIYKGSGMYTGKLITVQYLYYHTWQRYLKGMFTSKSLIILSITAS